MKLLILGPVVCAAAMALGQSAEKPSDPITIYQLPQVVPNTPLFVPKMTPQSSTLPGTDFDKAIVVGPPAGSFTVQPPRAPIPQAKRLYPDLKLQPTQMATLEPIPKDWPKFRIEPIPTQWQGMTFTLVRKK